jgi:hypothetical protein
MMQKFENGTIWYSKQRSKINPYIDNYNDFEEPQTQRTKKENRTKDET